MPSRFLAVDTANPAPLAQVRCPWLWDDWTFEFAASLTAARRLLPASGWTGWLIHAPLSPAELTEVPDWAGPVPILFLIPRGGHLGTALLPRPLDELAAAPERPDEWVQLIAHFVERRKIDDRLAKLHKLGGAAFVQRLAGILLENAPQQLADATTALTHDDRLAFRRPLHDLKSSAGNFGMVSVQRAAEHLELSAQIASTAELHRGLAGLIATFGRLRDYLTHRLLAE
jgi:HPt (histidine-containing phosphotransfer) domain-containing protein